TVGTEEFISFSGENSVAFTPDSKRLAVTSDRDVNVWNLASREKAFTVKGVAPVISVAFSTDGKRLAAGSWPNTVEVWDVAGGKEPLTLRGKPSFLSAVAFSPDGQRIASTSSQSLTVWDLSTAKELDLLTFSGGASAF